MEYELLVKPSLGRALKISSEQLAGEKTSRKKFAFGANYWSKCVKIVMPVL